MAVCDYDRKPTRSEFDAATPLEKGWLAYTWAQHPNSDIPEECPYPEGSQERADYMAGKAVAVLDAQDSEN